MPSSRHPQGTPEAAASRPGLNPARNLVLIGYRATGKSAVGAKLAQALKRIFVDLDQVLVEETGRSIAEIVAQGGWPEFRRLEKELTARYASSRGLVLATGGGVVLDPENMQALRRNGLLIWLTADPATIQARLAGEGRAQDLSRPSLTGGGTIEEVAAVLESRQPLYQAAAQIIIDTAAVSIDEVVVRILAAVQAQEAS
jgi:shikimate kinase